MYKADLNVPVALIFFCRPETLRLVFEKIKEARPSKLFLIQDGHREGNKSDIKNMERCREIVEDIDWECSVFKNYADVNLGCGIRPYSGISWVFEHVDNAIFLEDDCVPANSFFGFCDEMLSKYKDDYRVGMISGLNYFKEFDFGGSSYGFVKSGAIWGWATWKDRWNRYDYGLKQLDDMYIKNNVLLDITPKFAAKKRLDTWQKTKDDLDKNIKLSYWDFQWGFTRHINSWLSIVPKYNQITNIGIGESSTHSGNIKRLPKKIASFFFMEVKELETPLDHPQVVLANRKYDYLYYKIIYPNYLVKVARRISRFFRN
ncbi:hypothetical protein [Paenibacillus sp. FSL R7-269]|uniref:hypothetical protein n=1 Tax=Paenibacillus sp. FSL R7-269 TaxID=1226755 RepID=UPI0004B020D5|nr:hypothetical protein [Paenibacillus sp. FSL R7-269]